MNMLYRIVFTFTLLISFSIKESLSAPFGLNYGMQQEDVLKVLPANKDPSSNHSSICTHLSTVIDFDTLKRIGTKLSNEEKILNLSLKEAKFRNNFGGYRSFIENKNIFEKVTVKNEEIERSFWERITGKEKRFKKIKIKKAVSNTRALEKLYEIKTSLSWYHYNNREEGMAGCAHFIEDRLFMVSIYSGMNLSKLEEFYNQKYGPPITIEEEHKLNCIINSEFSYIGTNWDAGRAKTVSKWELPEHFSCRFEITTQRWLSKDESSVVFLKNPEVCCSFSGVSSDGRRAGEFVSKPSLPARLAKKHFELIYYQDLSFSKKMIDSLNSRMVYISNLIKRVSDTQKRKEEKIKRAEENKAKIKFKEMDKNF